MFRMRTVLAGMVVAVSLAGCDDPAIEHGAPPALGLARQSVSVPLYSYAAARRLRAQVAALGGGDPGSLRAAIRTTSPVEAQAARTRLIGDGIAPAAITVQPVPGDVVVVSRVAVRQADCRDAIRPGYLGDVSNSIDSLGRCVQADNLAAMVAQPADLVAPPPLAPADGAVAARAVLDWEKGSVKQPQQQRPYGDAGGSGGDAGEGDAGTASAPATAPAVGGTGRAGGTGSAPAAANPLLAPGL